jgi:hypothetical protein
MTLKTYERPEVELLRFAFEANFCESGGLEDYTIIPGPGSGMFEAPADIF